LRGRRRITSVRGRWLVGVLLVVGNRRVLRGIVLWVILAILLWVVLAVVLWVVLAVVLLWAVILLRLLAVASQRRPREAPLWWGVLVRVALLLVLGGVDACHICLRNSASSAHGMNKERRRHDQESGSRNTNTRAGAQPIPANPVTKGIVVTIFISHHGWGQQR